MIRAAVVQREIRPPLRRWAAERVARADPNRWSAVLQRGRDLDARSAAAVARGLLDAIDALPPATQRGLLAICGEWPQRDVRKAVKDAARQPRGLTTGVEKRSKPSDFTPKVLPKIPEPACTLLRIVPVIGVEGGRSRHSRTRDLIIRDADAPRAMGFLSGREYLRQLVQGGTHLLPA